MRVVFLVLRRLRVSWDYSFTEKARKQLQKLGHVPAQRIVRFLQTRVQDQEDPRQFGKGLSGDLGDFRRYRVDDYRILCEIKDQQLIVLVVHVGHRRDVYD